MNQPPPDEASDEIGNLCDRLGLSVTGMQLTALREYLDLLQRWNQTYNLTAVRERDDMLSQHLADCLALVPPLKQRQPKRVLDVGSGGGLPGVVIAALLPQCDVTCVDSVGKKTAFVRQVAGSLRLPNLHAIHNRVETLRVPTFDLITSRAFASLANFAALTAKHLSPQGVWVAMKGRTPADEIAELPRTIDVFHVEQLIVPGLDAQRCLVWMQERKNA